MKNYILISCLFGSLGVLSSIHVSNLESCPDKPNCVSSLVAVTDSHYIDPIKTSINDDVKSRFLEYFKSLSNVEIKVSEGDIFHIVYTSSLFKFKDDLYVQFDPNGVINFKSQSRSGYYDFSVNRKRVEEIKFKFRQRAF